MSLTTVFHKSQYFKSLTTVFHESHYFTSLTALFHKSLYFMSFTIIKPWRCFYHYDSFSTDDVKGLRQVDT